MNVKTYFSNYYVSQSGGFYLDLTSFFYGKSRFQYESTTCEDLVLEVIGDRNAFDFSFANIFTSQTIFRIGFLTYFLLFPIVLAVTPLREKTGFRNFPRFSPSYLFVIWSVIGVTAVLTVITTDGDLRTSLSETREMFYAVFIFYHTLTLVDWTFLNSSIAGQSVAQ